MILFASQCYVYDMFSLYLLIFCIKKTPLLAAFGGHSAKATACQATQRQCSVFGYTFDSNPATWTGSRVWGRSLQVGGEIFWGSEAGCWHLVLQFVWFWAIESRWKRPWKCSPESGTPWVVRRYHATDATWHGRWYSKPFLWFSLIVGVLL